MRKEKKKSDCGSTSIIPKSVIVFLLCQNVIELCSASPEIIGSSVVTSVSVITNHEGRNQKEVSFETSTAAPLAPPAPLDMHPFEVHYSSSPAYTGETPAVSVVTTLPTTASTNSDVRAQSPVFVHSQPFVPENEEQNHQNQQQQQQHQDVVENATEPPAPVAEAQPPPPPPQLPSSSTSPPEQENDAQAEPVRAESEIYVAEAEPSTSPLPPRPTPSTLPPFFASLLSKASRRADDDGIRVIDALKDIVRQAQQQHAKNDIPKPAPLTVTLMDGSSFGSSSSNNNNKASSFGSSNNKASSSASNNNNNNANSNSNKLSFGQLPPVAMPIQEEAPPQKIIPGTGINGDDDDEMEIEVNAVALDPGAATTDAIDEFAKHVVKVQQDDNSPENENENAEVSDAMHKISGAILSPNDDLMKQRPVDAIVNDVLGGLNSKRPLDGNTTPARPSSTTTSTTTTTTTTTTPKPTTTTRKTTTRPPTRPSTRPTQPSTRVTTTTTTTPRPTTTTRATTTTRRTTTSTTTTTTTTPKPTTTTQVRTTRPPPTTTTTRRTTPATKRVTTTTTTTTTQRPTTTTRTTTQRSTTRPSTTTQRSTTTNPPPRTTARPTSTFLPRSSSRVTPSTTPKPSTTLRPRPPQTTEVFAYGGLFNTGLEKILPVKNKPVMYNGNTPDMEVPPPPYQGAPPASSTQAPPPPTPTSDKPMSALEQIDDLANLNIQVMIKQAEQMGQSRPAEQMGQSRPQYTPVIQISNSDVFDPEPLPVVANVPVQSQNLPLSSSSSQPSLPMTMPPQEEPMDYRIPGIPSDESMEQSTSAADISGDSSDSSASSGQTEPYENELEQEEEFDMDHEVEFTTLKPYVPPSKKPVNSFMDRRPANETSSSKKHEFYDDEIFGFDPYQTFHHGVYVPHVDVMRTDAEQESSEELPPPTAKPKRRKRPRPSSSSSSNIRPFVKHGKPTKPRPSSGGYNKNSKKPIPNLPDYLHRPRPSHLQYQHGAADDTDPLTGLLNANYKHPGQGYGPETQTFAPDRLLALPPQALPHNVRKNLTDHHDHHYQHQHGLVVPGHGHGHGGHGHDSHGAHGSEGGHLAHGHVPNQPTNHLSSSSGGSSSSDNQPIITEKRPEFGPAPPGNPGLEATLTSVDAEMRSFVDINNRIALRLFSSLTNPVSKSSTSYGNMVVSPFTITSSLSMLFLGARGNTASQLDGLLRLDDMLTFNPHMMYHNITQAFLSQPNTAAAMIRLLIADKGKGGILDFYRTRVQHFYDARVEQADYKFAGHLAQSIINQMIRAQIQRHSYELLNYSVPLSGPMSLLTATFFDGQFAGTRDPKVDGMNFIHLAALGRRLFPVPALSVKGNFRAAYDNDLDATAVEIPYTSRDLSLIVMMPGKPGEFSIGGVASLKSKLTLESWTQLMRGFYPRDSFKVVLPRFRHQTAVNLTYTLKRFGLTDLFASDQAQFKGINGLADLHVDENMMHFTEFATWEKLSDTLTENNMQNNKNLDLVRILRPYVKDQYGQYQEPLSVNDWISMSRNPLQRHHHQSQQRSRAPTQPQMMDIRLALRLAHAEEKLKLRQTASGARSNTNPHLTTPLRSFMRPKGKRSKTSRSAKTGGRRRSNNRHHHRRQRRQAHRYYARQEVNNNAVEIEERVLKFERPFIYVLRHNPTGMILMTGQYTEPVTEVLE